MLFKKNLQVESTSSENALKVKCEEFFSTDDDILQVKCEDFITTEDTFQVNYEEFMSTEYATQDESEEITTTQDTLQVKTNEPVIKRKKSGLKYIPAVDLHMYKFKSAKDLVINTIKNSYSAEVSSIRFITGRGNHVNSNGERGVLFQSFPTMISSGGVSRLIKSYIKHDGSFTVLLKSPNELTSHDLDTIKQAASNDDVEAQFTLGLMYIDGSVKRDVQEALRWLKKSANKGVEKDVQKALNWLTKSAEKGYIKSQLLVGRIYSEGEINTKQKDKKAFKWFSKAAEQGDVNAQLMIGHLLYEGKGVVKNDEEAFKWFEKAAKQGDVNAQLCVGRLLYEGNGGIMKNESKAFKWFKKAAEHDHVDAQLIVGNLFAAKRGHLEAGIISEISKDL
ncbi:12262_t:CDS:2 [Funneliformis mosseae]|uniref:12262_t:CDS:1 n=1 Tax=Funneliformis mosseae TaxID=27381 RepID=A0A9N8VAC9_FUNMO|nr:12262_t:CDS:2 [Funneliformis mosseae]